MPDLALDRSIRTYDKAGHLHVEMANISKANVCPYLGKEIPGADELGLDPDKVYRLLRDPKELAKAASTFTGKPLVLKHRPQTAEDHDREITVGSVGETIFVAPFLRAPLAVWDGAGIEAIETEKQRELSCGYFYRADMTPGEFEGEPYDGRMVDIAGNHVALVETGRAGPDVFVGDTLPLEIQDMPALSRKAALVKGVLHGALRPLLAADAQINLSPLVRDVTAANWGTTKPKVITALKVATKGKLAQDADIEDVVQMLDKLEDVVEEMPDEEPKAAEDEKDADDETEEERKERLARRAAAKDKSAKDDKPKGLDKAAMDSAIQTAATEAESRTVARMNAIREAERLVRPIIGEVVVAMDSAEAVHRLALDHLKVDVTGVHPSAFPALLVMQMRATEARTTIAQDAAPAEGFAKRWGRDALPVKHQ